MPDPRRTRLAMIVLLAMGAGIAGYSDAGQKPPAKAPPAAAAPTAAETPPPPDPVETLKQETQEKFDASAKVLAEIRDRLDKLEQDIRVNAKSIEDLKAKLEQNAILVYKHLSRGIAGAEKLDQMSKRLDTLEGRPGNRPRFQPMTTEAAEGKPAAAVPAVGSGASAAPASGDGATQAQNPPTPPATTCPAGEVCPDAAQAAKPQSPALPDEAVASSGDREALRPIVAAILVLIVLPGLGFLEMSQLETWALPQAGLRYLLLAAVAVLAYFAAGHGLMYGERLFSAPASEAEAGPAQAFLLYQSALVLVASGVVATILSDRLSLPGYVFLALLFSGLAFPVLGHWVWAGRGLPTPIGWLERRGFQDFAGATVIHSFAAWFALGWVWRFPVTRLLGPAEPGGTPPRPNQALAPLGVFLVWLGWFGLAMGSGDSPPAAVAIVNTLLAGAAALVAALVYLVVPPRDSAAAAAFVRVPAGTVAGLVALSAGVDRVTPVEAITIGALAGVLHPLACQGLTATLIRRDQIAANLVAAYGVCGMFGTLCLGLFGSPGTFSAPSLSQFENQALGALAALGFGLVVGLFGALLCEGFSRLNMLRRSG